MKHADASAVPTGVQGARIAAEDVQILFVDLQQSLVDGSRTTAPADIARAAGVLAQVAAILHLPMLFSVVAEGDAGPVLLAALAPYSTPDNTVLRVPAGALMDARTRAAMTDVRRRIVVVAGYVAEVAVLQAVLDARAAGHTVLYVVDAVGSSSARTEAAAFREMEIAGAVPVSVLSLATRLAPDFSASPGSEIFAALKPLLR